MYIVYHSKKFNATNVNDIFAHRKWDAMKVHRKWDWPGSHSFSIETKLFMGHFLKNQSTQKKLKIKKNSPSYELSQFRKFQMF